MPKRYEIASEAIGQAQPRTPIVNRFQGELGARIVRWPEVHAKTGLAKSTVYHLISKGLFPKSRKLGPHVAGWLSTDIDTWFESIQAA